MHSNLVGKLNYLSGGGTSLYLGPTSIIYFVYTGGEMGGELGGRHAPCAPVLNLPLKSGTIWMKVVNNS